MTPTSRKLDCVIIGHHDTGLDPLLRVAKATRMTSGAYENIKANTVVFRGRRMSYMDLLSDVLTEARGDPVRLSVWNSPHLGVHYLASFLRRRGCRVEMLNFFTEQQERLSNLLAEKPSTVAITTTFHVTDQPIAQIVDYVRRRSPDTRIIVGGPRILNICSTQDEERQNTSFRGIGADVYIHDAQGEDTLWRAIDRIAKGNAFGQDDIPNLIYTSDNKTFRRTPRAPENNDLNENTVDWRLFAPSSCTPAAVVRTTRGCPYRCSFCRYPLVAGKYTLADLDVLEREMRMLAEVGVRYVSFIDDSFNVPSARFKGLCRMMIRRNFPFQWVSYLRCSEADEETIDLMREAGCQAVFLGIESADPSILRYMNKRATVEQYRRAIGQLKERGILTYVSTIIGFPGETEATVRNTRSFIEDTAPTFYRAELYYHDLRTPIQERAAEFQLRGRGYGWRHRSMDWRQACSLIKDMYRGISTSTILPLYMFDIWSFPYLMGQGISLSHIIEFLKIARDILLQGLDENNPQTDDQTRLLISLFARD